MQDISEMLIQIMEERHCNAMTALMCLRGENDVSDTLFIRKPLSNPNDTDNQGAR